MDQPPAVAFTAFAGVWPRATETEIGTVLFTIGAGRTLTFFYLGLKVICHKETLDCFSVIRVSRWAVITLNWACLLVTLRAFSVPFSWCAVYVRF